MTPSPTLHEIIFTAADVWDVTVEDILGNRQGNPISHVRHCISKLGWDFTDLTWPQMGLSLKKDQSSLRYGLIKAEELMATDGEFATNLNIIRARISKPWAWNCPGWFTELKNPPRGLTHQGGL